MVFARMLNVAKEGLAVGVARGIMKGIVHTHCKNWTIELLEQLIGQGVECLVPEEFRHALAIQAEKYPILANLTCQQFLEWVKEGNPALFEKMVANAPVMSWITQGWEAGRKELFRT